MKLRYFLFLLPNNSIGKASPKTWCCHRIRCLLLQSELVFRKCKVCRIRLMVPSFFDIMFTPCLPNSFNMFDVVGIEGWVVTCKPSDKSCNKSSGILHSFLSDLKIAFCLQGDQSQTDVFCSYYWLNGRGPYDVRRWSRTSRIDSSNLWLWASFSLNGRGALRRLKMAGNVSDRQLGSLAFRLMGTLVWSPSNLFPMTS